mgnify:CR=1 FL=1
MEGCKENKRDILNEEILMKKERLLYLDFVRALAAISIILTHHVIIAQIMGKYDYANISIIYSWILFILCCALIGLATVALYSMHRRMMGFITKCIEKE